MLKFNADGMARGKPGLVGFGQLCIMIGGRFSVCSPKGVGERDSNEAKVLAILEALRFFFPSRF